MIENLKKIHFIGIGGAGMSAIAYVLAKRGFQVTGSDLAKGHMADELLSEGATIYFGEHDAEYVADVDAVVASTAIHFNNPEIVAAKIRNIPILHRSDVLADIFNDGRGIAVAGAHGKTTTSAMLATITALSDVDPTIMIGGEVACIKGNARSGASDLVVAEADESDGSFLKLNPYIAVITNIENDHLDYYGTEEKIYSAFQQFLGNIKPGGTAVMCFDNQKVREIGQDIDQAIVTYGFEKELDYYAENVSYSINGTEYDLYVKNEFLTKVTLCVPGRHNVLNSLGAFAAAVLLGIPTEKIVEALAGFAGAKRRFETKGKVDGVWIVDDYAHHPTEIAVSLKAARQTNPKRIVCIFQPHRYTRTKILYNEFCRCFTDCDELILTHIYSAGESPLEGISEEQLIKDIVTATGQKAKYINDFADVEKYIQEIALEGDLIMTVGAGNVYQIGENLVKTLSEAKNNG